MELEKTAEKHDLVSDEDKERVSERTNLLRDTLRKQNV